MKPKTMAKNGIKIISGSSHFDLATRVSKSSKVDLVDAEMQYFSNTEMRPVVRESIRNKNIYIIQTGGFSVAKEERRSINDYIMEIVLLAKTCKRSDARNVNLVIPFFPYSRQDKKDNPRACISAKDMADIFEAVGIKRVITFDLHAPQIQGFFNIPCDNLYTTPLIKDYFEKNVFKKDKDYQEKYVVVAPDEGALKRVKAYASLFGLPFLVLSKERDYSKKNVVEQAVIIGRRRFLRDRTAIIIDDMIDTFGTINTATKLLMEHGTKGVMVAATHGILSGPAIERMNKDKNVKMVLVSDTLPQKGNLKKSKKLKVYSVAPMVAECVVRLESGRSLSELFMQK